MFMNLNLSPVLSIFDKYTGLLCKTSKLITSIFPDVEILLIICLVIIVPVLVVIFLFSWKNLKKPVNTKPVDKWKPIYDPEKNGDMPAKGVKLPPLIWTPMPIPTGGHPNPGRPIEPPFFGGPTNTLR